MWKHTTKTLRLVRGQLQEDITTQQRPLLLLHAIPHTLLTHTHTNVASRPLDVNHWTHSRHPLKQNHMALLTETAEDGER